MYILFFNFKMALRESSVDIKNELEAVSQVENGAL